MDKLDSADIGEMVIGAEAAQHSGFGYVTIDPGHLLQVLAELLELHVPASELRELVAKWQAQSADLPRDSQEERACAIETCAEELEELLPAAHATECEGMLPGNGRR